MQSLVISRWSPGQINSGAGLRNTQNMAALAELGPVDVIVVDPDNNIQATAQLDGVTRIAEYIPARANHFPGRWLLPGPHHLIRRYTDDTLVTRLKRLSASDYDLALVEEISLSAYVQPLVQAGIRTVFDAHNVEARLWDDIERRDGEITTILSRLRQSRFNRKLKRAEKRVVNTAGIIWACSVVDAALLERLYQPKGQVGVVPNAIDVEAYAQVRTQRKHISSQDTLPMLIYIGTYSYAPNEVAALRLINDIVPALRRAGISLDVTIIGRHPTLAMQQAAEKVESITVTGAVDSVEPYLANSIAVLPITIGGGTRLKILEAFAAQCPVISTAKGAEGIDVEHERNILLAESTEDFVQAIMRMVKDKALRTQIGEAGYDTVCQGYSWAAAARAVQETLSIPVS